MLFNRKSASRNARAAATSGSAREPTADRAVPDAGAHAAPPVPATASSAGHGSASPPRDIAARPNAVHTQSFIDASLTIVGDLSTDGDVRLEGRVCGNVRCAQLILGNDASVTGSVIADEAIIRGRITGTVRANAVVIQGSAHVESEIIYGALTIDDGASFEGIVRRSPSPLTEPAPVARPLDNLPEPASPAPSLGAAKAAERAEPAGDDAEAEGSEGEPAPMPVALPAPVANGQDRLANGHDRSAESG